MKFISRYSNYRLVLKPGLQAQPLVGMPSTPGVSIRFEDGMAEVTDPEYIKLVKAHPDFGTNILAAEDPATDDFVRTGVTPEHNTMEIGFGRVMKTSGAPKTVNPELLKLVKKMAMDIVKAELPKMAREEAMKIAPQLAMDLIKDMQQATEGIEENSAPAPRVQTARRPNPMTMAPEPLSAEEAGLKDMADAGVDMEPEPKDNLTNEPKTKTVKAQAPKK